MTKETFVERKVTYTLDMDGRFIIVENVPARVCVETGERFFSPETVERLQRLFWATDSGHGLSNGLNGLGAG